MQKQHRHTTNEEGRSLKISGAINAKYNATHRMCLFHVVFMRSELLAEVHVQSLLASTCEGRTDDGLCIATYLGGTG